MPIRKKKGKIVRLLARGQVTIPAEFRERLGVDADALLSVKLVGRKLQIEPVRLDEAEELREYTDKQIQMFLKQDRIDPATAGKVRRLLAGGKL